MNDDSNQDREDDSLDLDQPGNQVSGSKGGKSSGINPVQIQKLMQGLDYPASRKDLVEHAREQGADNRIIQALSSLPDEQFDTPADVSQAVGENEK